MPTIPRTTGATPGRAPSAITVPASTLAYGLVDPVSGTVPGLVVSAVRASAIAARSPATGARAAAPTTMCTSPGCAVRGSTSTGEVVAHAAIDADSAAAA